MPNCRSIFDQDGCSTGCRDRNGELAPWAVACVPPPERALASPRRRSWARPWHSSPKLPIEDIFDTRQIFESASGQPALIGCDVSDIGHSRIIRHGTGKFPVKHILRDRQGVRGICRRNECALLLAAQPALVI